MFRQEPLLGFGLPRLCSQVEVSELDAAQMPWRPKDEMLHPVEGRFLVQRVGSTCPCRRSTFRSLEMAQHIQGRVGRKVQFLLEGFFGFLDLSLYHRVQLCPKDEMDAIQLGHLLCDRLRRAKPCSITLFKDHWTDFVMYLYRSES